MPDCGIDILDLSTTPSVPNDTDVTIYTQTDGTSVLRTWAVVKAAILAALNPPYSETQYIVSVTSGGPTAGTSTWTPTGGGSLVGASKIEYFVGGVEMRQIGSSPDVIFNSGTGQITVTVPFAANDWIKIKKYS